MQRLQSRLKLVPIHSIHCSGQRGDYEIGNDIFRPKKIKLRAGTTNQIEERLNFNTNKCQENVKNGEIKLSSLGYV